MTSVESKKRSLIAIAWEGLIMGATTLAAIVIPARLVLAPEEQPLSLVLDAALTALLGVDLILGVRRRSGVGRSRAWNWCWLSVDVLAALPTGSGSGAGRCRPAPPEQVDLPV